MKIGELSARTGCPVTRIRFYEAEGVLPKPRRTQAGQRSYSADDEARLRFILECRTNGMHLSCVKELLRYKDNPELGGTWICERIDYFIASARTMREDLARLEVSLTELKTTLMQTEKRTPQRGASQSKAAS